MKRFMSACILSLAAVGMSSALASEDRVDHAEGRPAETLAEAVGNLVEYNPQLEALLASENLSAGDLHDIHMLSYTLENALQRIDEELEAMAVALEEMHLASEEADQDTTVRNGRAYLEATNTLIRAD